MPVVFKVPSPFITRDMFSSSFNQSYDYNIHLYDHAIRIILMGRKSIMTRLEDKHKLNTTQIILKMNFENLRKWAVHKIFPVIAVLLFSQMRTCKLKMKGVQGIRP